MVCKVNEWNEVFFFIVDKYGWNIGFCSYFGIVFIEGWCDVYDICFIISCYERVWDYMECLFWIFSWKYKW